MQSMKKSFFYKLIVLSISLGLITPVWSAVIGDDDAKMIVWAEEQAAKGDVMAQVNLATLYYSGTIVDQNYNKAFELYEKAANQGNADAQGNVGNMYFFGKGVRQDYLQAFKWYEKAASQGSPGALGMLGLMYRDGKGVRQDRFKAKSWFGKSCDKGVQLSCDHYRKLNEQGY